MAVEIKYRATGIILIIFISLIPIHFTGCKRHQQLFTIGIVSDTLIDNESLKGFKEGMAELGYIEGKNLKYIYKKVIEHDEKDIAAGVKEVLAQDVDILLPLGEGSAISVREHVKGIDIPVLFCGDAWPVENSLVVSLLHPGGNITGVRPAQSISKALEWLVAIVPGAKKIWLPYNPDDRVSVEEIPRVEKAASQLGIELFLHRINSIEEAVSDIEGLPKDINAIFIIPSPTLDRRCDELNRAAVSRRIPIGASIKVDEAVLISLTSDFFNMGKKAARLAQQIHQGVKPADLPVETAEVKLIINLKTAEEIGLDIPDSILSQATTIIR